MEGGEENVEKDDQGRRMRVSGQNRLGNQDCPVRNGVEKEVRRKKHERGGADPGADLDGVWRLVRVRRLLKDFLGERSDKGVWLSDVERSETSETEQKANENQVSNPSDIALELAQGSLSYSQATVPPKFNATPAHSNLPACHPLIPIPAATAKIANHLRLAIFLRRPSQPERTAVNGTTAP